MKIFYAAGSSPNTWDIFQSQLWKVNLFDTLVNMGHEVIPFTKDVTWHFSAYRNYQTSPVEHEHFLKYKKELKVNLVEEICREHRRGPIDLFFSYFWTDICEPDTIYEIGSLGIVTVNWYCNASYQFHLVERLAPAYSYCLVPEKFRLKDYRRVGANPVYCQEAANPNIYHPYDLPVVYEVVFVGQKYGNRPLFIKHLADAGFDVRAFGPGWLTSPSLDRSRHLWYRFAKRCKDCLSGSRRAAIPAANVGPTLSDDEYIKMYSRSRISLGFTTTAYNPKPGEQPIKQVRLRDFEAPMSGAFYLIEYFDELTEFFEPDKEIVFFHDPDDLADKVRYYLTHDEERECIRQAGLRRARNEHTWQRRFEKAFKQMGFP